MAAKKRNRQSLGRLMTKAAIRSAVSRYSSDFINWLLDGAFSAMSGKKAKAEPANDE